MRLGAPVVRVRKSEKQDVFFSLPPDDRQRRTRLILFFPVVPLMLFRFVLFFQMTVLVQMTVASTSLTLCGRSAGRAAVIAAPGGETAVCRAATDYKTSGRLQEIQYQEVSGGTGASLLLKPNRENV